MNSRLPQPIRRRDVPSTVHHPQILESMRKDASSLQKLRHPNVMSIIEPLIEESRWMGFVTKGVTANLGQLLVSFRGGTRISDTD